MAELPLETSTRPKRINNFHDKYFIGGINNAKITPFYSMKKIEYVTDSDIIVEKDGDFYEFKEGSKIPMSYFNNKILHFYKILPGEVNGKQQRVSVKKEFVSS
jgi:hypothetical protein